MSGKRALGILIALMMITGTIIPFYMTVFAQPPVPKGVYGVVDANVTGVRAFDPVKNGVVACYIINRTDKGTDLDAMKDEPFPFDYYWNAIEDSIPQWREGDPAIVVVSVENGTYGGGDRAGYVAYANDTLDLSADQQFADAELMKIPVPTFTANESNYINLSWTPLSNPWGLIMGYTVYRSDSNSSDFDWTLISGDKNNPVTDDYYNDTSVTPGSTFYYALMVSFKGYANDNPGSVANYECLFFGEGSTFINTSVSALGVDYIAIVDDPTPLGANITTITIDIGKSTPQVYAVGYNISGPTFVGAVEVDWTPTPALGVCAPSTGTLTIFTAFLQGGTVDIVGLNSTLGLSDNFTVEINPPTVDYIELQDAPNGSEIADGPWNISVPLPIYASGYNNTGPTYVGLVDVDWTDNPDLGDFNNATGTASIYTGTSPGITTLMGEDTINSIDDTFQINILIPPTIDNIKLTDAENGMDLNFVDLLVNEQVTIYASGYNGTTFIKLVNVSWADLSGLGSFDNNTGTSTTFTALFVGITIIEGTNATLSVSDTFQINITEPPSIDFILLTDAGGTNLTTENIPIGGQITVYASGHNTTFGFVRWVEVDWSADPTNLGFFSTILGTSTIYTVYTTPGSINITGENASMTPIVSDYFNLTILPPTVDYIELQDAPNGTAFITETLNVEFSIIIYASGYNNTGSTYAGLVAVTWSHLPDLGGSFNPPSGDNTTFTAGTTTGFTTVTGDNGLGLVDTFDINIVQLDINYINITDVNEVKITSVTLNVGQQITIYAYGYNTSASPHVSLGLIEVEWTQDPTLGSFDLTTGPSATFTAGNAGGTTTITGTNSSLTDDFSLTVNPPIIDYIMIVDTAGTGSTEIPDMTVNVGVSITGYAASFNNTIGFLQDISVTWSVLDSGGAVTSTTPASGDSSVFNSGSIGGLTTWTADDGSGNTDTVAFTIRTPTVDYIQIRDTAGNAGIVVLTDTFTEGDSKSYYCAAYNNSGGYIDDVGATWGVTGPIGAVDPTSGQLTQFSASTAGTGTVTATYSGITNSTSITVNAAEVAPDPPTGLVVNQVPAGESLRLTWDTHPDPDDDLAGYNVYRSTTNVTGFQLANTGGLITDTTFTDTNRTNGVVYYYRITAVDDSALESADSAIVDGICDADTDGDEIYNLQDDDDDGDGLTDAEELELGTNRLLVDTDGDGHNDKEDKYPLDADKWKDEDEDSSILLILIIVIVIIVVLVLVLFLMKKKGSAEAPILPEEEVKPPEEEMPSEGEVPSEEDMPPPEDEEVPPPEDEASPSEEEAAPPEGEMPPTKEEAPSGEERKLPPPPK